MSGEGPESVPTSADPRSKRPVKKRALTPVSEQAASLDALFAKPDQEIRIPAAGSNGRPRGVAPPPEIVTNVQGSSAGAGSGEFHVYKASRRREYERLRAMDEEVAREQATEDFERARAEKLARDEEKTRRNREKREKMKARKDKAKQQKGKGGADGNTKTPGGGIKARVDGNGTKPDAEDGGSTNMDVDTKSGQDSQRGASDTPGLVIHDDD
ncbi:putative duf1168 domain protein [Phaeoacremonium minimum UCRPA7]|uniref:Putative duf1168 domain protein n=1 Tax=Phaeoacremonium minimum (strain UCR-PA7) TaxID=1286976 RepID=R8BL18_PHAM7|nr:putative duf1168 domain protein [Phaeoacremonium minimum UCRPA7]EOO00044.1 putative duf1168 domain protein [Phaeoacremonium minimum UCRPA7]